MRNQTKPTEFRNRMPESEIQEAIGETFPDIETGAPVGNLYNEVQYGGQMIRVGDIVAYYDRPGHSDYKKRITVGRIDAILDPMGDGEHRPELFVSGQGGRVPITVEESERRTGRVMDVQISGEDSTVDEDSLLTEYVEEFRNRDYSEYMTVKIEKVQPEDGRKSAKEVPTFDGE